MFVFRCPGSCVIKMAGAGSWKVVLGTVTIAVPVTVTFLDLFGYIARVEGASMQVYCFIDLTLLMPQMHIVVCGNQGLSQDFHRRVSKLRFQESRVSKIPD